MTTQEDTTATIHQENISRKHAVRTDGVRTHNSRQNNNIRKFLVCFLLEGNRDGSGEGGGGKILEEALLRAFVGQVGDPNNSR